MLSRIVARLIIYLILITSSPVMSQAAVLPEERLDAMYHSYDGGGVKVDGPALLVRKNFAEQVSVSAFYYADAVSSASIDVLTTASPFTDDRTESGLGIDYLRRNTLMSLSFSTSDEEDYQADTVNFSLAQEMFGGMTTLTLGYGVGRDVVSRVDNDFEDDIDRYSYRLGLSQILSKTLLVNVDYEAVADDGFLNSPYRAAQILGAFVPERYPRTRESHALSLRILKYLQSGRSLRAEYRRFWDTWDISADTLELGFNKYFGRRWLMEFRYRYYTQDAASFYSDNFTAEQNFMARDKELSTFTSNSLGGKFSYTFLQNGAHTLVKGTFSFSYDFIKFDYDNFTDIRNGKLFSFDADVIQLFVSLWY
ncbi:MAG: DUF3570 domain-containing protein [Proteobacteria bacterium]|nr:MAG: DUF3570 domain-containing protein [Pseudomonadota bacterium]TDJ74931.1 MAG: DUF3570 domain-containing protein [Pseudomonadota bacterium]